MFNGVKTQWIMARFSGKQAEYVSGLAAHGIGYYVLERPDTGSAWVVAAFSRPLGPLEPHHTPVTEQKLLDKLDKWYMPEREDRTKNNQKQHVLALREEES